MSYSYTEFLPSALTTGVKTRLVVLETGKVYTTKILSISGVTVTSDPTMDSYVLSDEFNYGGLITTTPEVSRCLNCVVAKSDGVAKVVLPREFDNQLVDRIKLLLKALRDGDPNIAFQCITSISYQTKNKIAEHNHDRERKSRKSGEVKPWTI